jgi:hypothetical protein
VSTFKKQNALIGLLMVYVNNDKYIEMSYEHALANGDSSNVSKENEIKGHCKSRGDELKRGINLSILCSLVIISIALLIAYFSGVINPALPIDKFKLLFGVGAGISMFVSFLNALPKPASMSGNTLAENSHTVLTSLLLALASIAALLSVLV